MRTHRAKSQTTGRRVSSLLFLTSILLISTLATGVPGASGAARPASRPEKPTTITARSKVVADGIVGSVVDSSGAPLAGVKVDLFMAADRHTRGPFLDKASSGDAGGYEFPKLKPGCYITVTIAPKGFHFKTGTRWQQNHHCVKDQKQEVLVVSISADPELAGQVKTVPAGKPVAGVQIDLFEAKTKFQRGQFLGPTKTDADGRFRFGDLAEGCYITVVIANRGQVFENGKRWHQTHSCVDGPDDPGPCIVGDDCPLYRIIDSRGKCAETTGTGIGNDIVAAATCDSRQRAFNDPRVQLDFRSNGEIRISLGLCISAAADGDVSAASCDGGPDQQWNVDDAGRILAEDGRCLAAVQNDDPSVRVDVGVEQCDAHADPTWVFLPVVSDGPYRVQTVYLTAPDSAETDRADVWQQAAVVNQRRWANNDSTWQLISTPVMLNTSFTDCADIGTGNLAPIRTEAINGLARAGEFNWDTKYLVGGECDIQEAVANAGSTTAVFDAEVLTRIEQESVVDPENAQDGDMDFTGSVGHELGHLYGLYHENCQANPARIIPAGWQGQADQGLAEVLGIPSTTLTRGYLCNTAFFPNPDPLTSWQQAIAYEEGCQWLAECENDGVEFGSDGRPFGCVVQSNTVFWDTTRPNQTFTVYSSFLGSTEVEASTGNPVDSRLGVLAVTPTPGEITHYAVSLDGQDGPEQREPCGHDACTIPDDVVGGTLAEATAKIEASGRCTGEIIVDGSNGPVVSIEPAERSAVPFDSPITISLTS